MTPLCSALAREPWKWAHQLPPTRLRDGFAQALRLASTRSCTESSGRGHAARTDYQARQSLRSSKRTPPLRFGPFGVTLTLASRSCNGNSCIYACLRQAVFGRDTLRDDVSE